MNIKIMVQVFCILFPALSYCGSGIDKKEEKDRSTDQREKKPDPDTSKKNGVAAAVMRGVTWGCVGQIAGTCVMFTVDPKVKTYIEDRSNKGKHLFLQKVAIPVHLKMHAVQEEGLTKKDVLTAMGCVGGMYGLKKMLDFFGLWQALKGDTSRAVEAVNTCISYVADHKLVCTLIGTVSLALLAGIIVSQNKKTPLVVTPAQLFESLTDDQRKKILESRELEIAIKQIESDPLMALMHEELLQLLTKDQRELLEHIAAEHEKNNPHLALLD